MSPRTGLWIIFGFSIAILGAFITLDQMAPAGRRLAKIKGEDPVGYFGIAHSVLFDHDYNLNNEYEHMPPDRRFWSATQPATGLPGSPWGLGYSFAAIPLLAIGTAVDALTGNPADGYGPWAVFCYCIVSPIMAGFGMAALYTLLRSVSDPPGGLPEEGRPMLALFVTLAIFFGTNVGYYAFSEMAHASTFLFASWFLMIWWRVRDSERGSDWLILGAIGGYLSICRWQDALYLGGPILYDLFGGACFRRSEWWKSRLLYAAGVGVCWIPQVMEWKAIYGKYLTIPQGGQIFSFPAAHVLQVLFSTQSGWFIWTPLTVLGVLGLTLGAMRAPRVYGPWMIVLSLQVAVVGSVTFWSGIESFGARYLLSSIPLLGVGVMTLLRLAPLPVRRGLVAASVVFCLFTSLFAVQYRLSLMPMVSPLTFSELITDKMRLPQVIRRKSAAKQAHALLAGGDAASAIEISESTRPLGEDRDVDAVLIEAYRAAGMTDRANAADLRYRKFLDSRWY